MIRAPIGISTYSRVSHLAQTVEALRKNISANESIIYIFSDAPKEGDEEKIREVRRYLKTISGFKKINIIERDVNDRVANNRGGINQLLAEYGRFIFLEEDIVTAPGFLNFMNEALDFYEDNDQVISITGYCPPIAIPESYKYDAFALKRFNAWGFASWKNKFDPFGFDVKEHGIEKFLKDRKSVKQFKTNGEDMYNMLLLEYEGRLDALDVKLMFYQHMNDKHTIYPKKSLVQNIGHDGSGMHCGVSDKFTHKELWVKSSDFHFMKDIKEDPMILRENFKFRRLGLRGKIINLTKFLGIFPLLKKIKDKL